LGNPGPEYEDTYHNVGFRVVAAIAEKSGARIRERCGPALISGPVQIGGEAAILVLPQTFMNRSGEALPKLFERFEADCSSLLVVYDDLDLPIGKLRVRQKGSAGGHNGIKSLISTCGTDVFLRVRVGIRPEHPISDSRTFVLSRVSKKERTVLERSEDAARSAVVQLIAEGLEPAMAAFNGIDLREAVEGN